MFVALAAGVFSGKPTMPVLALLILLAPLLALLIRVPRAEEPGSSVVTALAGLLTVGMVLAANVVIVTDVAALGEIPLRPWLGALVVAAGTILVGRHTPALWGASFVGGLAGLAVIVVAMGMALPAAPWTAWTQLASRPAFVFSPGAAWVTEGRVLGHSTTATFSESHQLTALSPGIFRVEPRDGTADPVREWPLGAGDGLALRNGDRLTIPPNARVRFEAGKRIPGTPASGVAWADPPRHPSWSHAVEALGLAVTCAGGAITLLSGSGQAWHLTGAVATPLALVTFAFAASALGVYATWFAADLGLGASSLTALVEAIQLVLGQGDPGIALVGGLGLALLSLAAAAGLESRVRTIAESCRSEEAHHGGHVLPAVLWLAMLVGGVILSQWPVSCATLLQLGLGFGASAWAAPRLAGAGGGSMGALTGAVVFAALSVAHALDPAALAPIGAYPALVAAPAAAAVAVMGRRRRPSSHTRRLRAAGVSVAGSRGA